MAGEPADRGKSSRPDGASGSILTGIRLFQGLTPAELARVESAGVVRRVEAGAFFYQQGDPAERVYVLLDGKVRLSQLTNDGQQVILRMASPVEAFGMLAVLSDSSYPVSAQAVEDSRSISWSRTEMHRLMERMPRLALNIIAILTRRVQEFQDRLRELATERVERRVARALLRLGNQVGRLTDEGVLIDMPLTRQDLAEMTGTTLYTVSRILSQWESQGLVRSRREQVVISFPHGLVTIAEDLPERTGREDDV